MIDAYKYNTVLAFLECVKIDMYISIPIKHLIKDGSSRQFANYSFISIYVSVNQELSIQIFFSKQVYHNLSYPCFCQSFINLSQCTVFSECSQNLKYLKAMIKYILSKTITLIEVGNFFLFKYIFHCNRTLLDIN